MPWFKQSPREVNMKSVAVRLFAVSILISGLFGCAPMKHRHTIDDVAGSSPPPGQSTATTSPPTALAANCKKGGVVFEESTGNIKRVKENCSENMDAECSGTNNSGLCNPEQWNRNNANIRLVSEMKGVTIETFMDAHGNPVPDFDIEVPGSACCIWGYVQTTTGRYPYCIVKATGNPAHC